MKQIFGYIVALVLIPFLPLQAADTVWYTPMPGTHEVTLAAGDPILVYAKVQNPTNTSITYVLSFDAAGKTIGTKIATLAAYTAQDISVSWTMPAEVTMVSVTAAKATDAQKKNLPERVGPIGSVQIGVAVVQTPSLDIHAIGGWFGKVVDTLERFRVKELGYFTDLKKESESILGRTTIKDVSDLLQPETKTTTASGSTTGVEKKDTGTTWGYVKLVYATLGKAFFVNTTVFFVGSIVVILLAIRFVVRLLFR